MTFIGKIIGGAFIAGVGGMILWGMLFVIFEIIAVIVIHPKTGTQKQRFEKQFSYVEQWSVYAIPVCCIGAILFFIAYLIYT